MSFTAPEGGAGGALIVGSIVARVGALFDPRGWDQQQAAAREAKRITDRPIEAKLHAAYDPVGSDRFLRDIRGAREQAARPIEAHARIRVSETDTRRVREHFGAARAEAKGLERDVEGVASKVEGLGFGIGRFATGIGGLLAGFGAFEVLRKGIDRMGELQRTSAITEARLKSTGDAAHVTAGHVEALASSIQRKTGIDHEQIATGENLLLTFTGIRDEVGRNRDVFDQATRAATDFSVGTGRDLTSSIRALGLALDNPEKGLTRLSRAGIIFSDQQKAQIKQLEASGNLWGAQELILGRVEKRFGGTADAAGKTMPAALDRARTAFKDISAEIAQRAAPTITNISNWFGRLADGLQHNTGAGRTLRTVIHEIGDAISWAIGGIKDLIGLFTGGGREATVLRGALVGISAALGGFIVFKEVGKWIDLAKLAFAGLVTAFEASPFGVVLAVAAAATLAIQSMGIKWKDLGGFISGVWTTIKRDVGDVVAVVRGFLHDHQADLDSIGRSVSKIADGIAHFASNIANWARSSGVLSTIGDAFKAIAGAVLDTVTWLLKLLTNRAALIAFGTAAAALVAALLPLAGALAVEKIVSFGRAIGGMAGNLRTATVELGRFFGAAVRGDLSGARASWSRLFGGGGGGPAAGGAGAAATEALYHLTGTDGTGVGSELNPIAVMVLGGLGAAGGAGGALPVAARGATAAEGEALAAGGIRRPSGLVLPPSAVYGLETAATEATVAPSLLGRLRGGAGALGGRLIGGLGIGAMGYGISQIAGGAIGGSAGSHVSQIGGMASLGAGLGSLLGPEGTIAGGVIGGLAGAFTSFFGGGHGPSKADQYAERFGTDLAGHITHNLPPAVRDGYAKGIAEALTAGKADQQDAVAAAARARAAARGTPTPHGMVTDPAAAAQARSDRGGATVEEILDYTRAGVKSAQAFQAGYASVRFKSAGGLVQAFKEELGTLPKTARNQAAESTIEMAAELERRGELPKGSLRKVLQGMEHELPGFRQFLRQQGMTTAQDFADQMKLTDARGNLQGAITDIQHNFGLMTGDTKVTGDNMDQQFKLAMDTMQQTAKTSTGRTRAAALRELGILRDQAAGYFSDLAQKTSDYMDQISGAIQKGSQTASANGQIAFNSLFSHIAGAMASNTLAASKGMSIIAQAVNSTLSAFGAPKIPVATIKAMTPQEAAQYMNYQFTGGTGATSMQGSSVGGGSGHGRSFRGGGMLGYRGQRAPDSEWVLAAPGEAFLTGDDQMPIDRALAYAHAIDPDANPYGSLDHLFSSDSRVAHYAEGGRHAGGGRIKYPHWPHGRSNWDAHSGYSWWVNWAMHHDRHAGHPGVGMGSGEFYDDLYGYFRTRDSRRIPSEAWHNWHANWDRGYTSYRRGGRYAGGGVVTASQYGGPGDPGTGHIGYKGDDLNVHPDSFAELNMGTALGGLPYMTPLDFTYQGHTARLFKRDIGAGGPGIAGHVRAADLWYRAAQALGLPGLANVMVNGPAGVNVHITGTAPGAGQIQAPSVHGGGSTGTILRRAMSRVADAGNALIDRMAPSANVTVGAGGPPVKHGRFTFPLPPGSWSAGRVDQGWDLTAGAHTPEFAIDSGTIIGHGISGFGPWAPILQLDGGGAVYYGHAGPGGELPVGTHVHAGQVIGEIGAGKVGLSTGPHLEIGWYPPGPSGAGASMKKALGYRSAGRHPTSHAPHVSASHARGAKISDRLLTMLTKTNPKLARDLSGLNRYSTDIDDLNARFDRTQRQQQQDDRVYGDQVPEATVRQQTGALIAIKQEIGKDLQAEASHATRIKSYLNDWIKNRTRAERQATLDETAEQKAIAADKTIITNLQDQLTGNARQGQIDRASAAYHRRVAAAQKRINSINQRIGRLRSEHGAARRGPAPVRYDVYGNKLPAPPGGSGRTVDHSQQISAATQELTAAQSELTGLQGGGISQDTRQRWKLQDQLTRARRRLTSDESRLKQTTGTARDVQKELDALNQIAQTLGDAADPQTGLPGQVQDTNMDIRDLQSALPAGVDGGMDWTALPGGEQSDLDQLNFWIAAAQGLPADQQTAAEIPLFTKLVSFWQNRLGELSRAGAPINVLTDTQGTINQAEQQLQQLTQGATTTAGTTPDQQAIINQQATQIQNLRQLNAAAGASLQALTSSGDIGTGGFANALQAADSGPGAAGPAGGGPTGRAPASALPAGGGPSIPPLTPVGGGGSGSPSVYLHVEALHPADPAVLHNIAAVTVNALHGQNWPRSSREKVL